MTKRHIAVALSGLHSVGRGAEVALSAIATELAGRGHNVTVFGGGPARPNLAYSYLQVPHAGRDEVGRYPRLPLLLNSPLAWEELNFALALRRAIDYSAYDITIGCSYPYTNWVLRRGKSDKRPPHLFVTENGDWPAYANNRDYRLFGCDGLACTNPEYYERNREKWRATLIPNGIDVTRFHPGPSERERLGLPVDEKIVFMASALFANKRVGDAIRAVAEVPDVHLVVAGDGDLRVEIDALAAELLPGRFTRSTFDPADMGSLYRSVDLTLHLATDESFGNVYIESTACGTPVVAHDNELTQWILGEDARLVDTFDPPLVVDALREVLHDPPAMDTAAKRCAERFSWTTIGVEYEQFIDRILKECR
jgi:glycosyltransferase involved in cell wall biosynthesis